MRSLVAVLLLCGLACIGNDATLAADLDSGVSAKFQEPFQQTGIASVDYGRVTRFDGANYHGRVATGERYDATAMAVAHRTLPLNSCIVVRLRERMMRAVVKDRGPCLSEHCRKAAPKRVRERILDLTPALARKLDCDGLCRVVLWRVNCAS